MRRGNRGGERGRVQRKGRKGKGDRDDRRANSARDRTHSQTPTPPSKVPGQSSETRRLLEGIGTPSPGPFKPDPFQLEALAALEFEDVLVTAPTGSGKTWIARE